MPSSTRPARPRPPSRERLLAFLDRLGAELDRRGDAVALLGLGSVGRDLHRLDEHSDADFFVVVDDAATRDRYIADIDWLEAAHPVVWSFENSDLGRKALLEGDLFAEYAVFSARRHGDRRLPAGPHPLEPRRRTRRASRCRQTPVPQPPSLEHEVGEAITNLYVGLHRDLRGERLTATRFIQGYAVDRWVTVLGHLGLGAGAQQDVFVVDRGVERRFGAGPAAARRPRARLRAQRARGGDAAGPARGARRARPDDRGRGARPHRPGGGRGSVARSSSSS